MKDKVVSALRIATGVGIVWYVSYLFVNNETIVKPWYANLNMVVLWVIWIFGLRVIFSWIKSFFIPRQRLIQCITWIVLILLWSYVLQDDPDNYVYLADILNILWAILMVVWPIGILINEKIKKQKEEEKIEIIEV